MLKVLIAAKTSETQDICVFDLVDPDGHLLPEFTAGAHVDVHLPGGLVRQYSLCNKPTERNRYRIAVLRTQDSRGGSICLHDGMQAGDVLSISAPRNLFALSEDKSVPALLFAGGIGITPVLAMAESLTHTGQAFSLHYCVRSPDRAAFLPDIAASDFAEHVSTYFDDGLPNQRLNTAEIFTKSTAGTHVYVCGPAGFMDHVLQTARHHGWPESHLHREYFNAVPVDHSADGVFAMKIASTGEILDVPADKTALQVLLDRGFDIPMSCEQGICGTCLTGVLDGVPNHRDQFQTDEELQKNNQFTPCCSRSETPVLLLDL